MKNINTLSQVEVIGFDADDTLWENEDIFLEAQNELKIILMDYVDNLDEELLKTEKLNLKLYVYGVKGFILSVIETSIMSSNGKLDIHGIKNFKFRKENAFFTCYFNERCKKNFRLVIKKLHSGINYKGRSFRSRK